MVKVRRALAAGAFGAALMGVALAAGMLTNGLPLVQPTTWGATTNVAPNGVVTQLVPVPGNAVNNPSDQTVPDPRIPVDINRGGGSAPQTVATSPFYIAATYAEISANTTTSTAHNAVLATEGALVTTESLSTAAGATYTFTWTNSLITASSTPCYAAMFSKSNTGLAQMTVTSSTITSGVCTIVFKNVGSAALNGTMMIALHV